MQFKMAAGENFAVVTKSGGTLTLPDVENGSSTSLLSLDEAEAGYTRWKIERTPSETGADPYVDVTSEVGQPVWNPSEEEWDIRDCCVSGDMAVITMINETQDVLEVYWQADYVDEEGGEHVASYNATRKIIRPTKTSQLMNDSGFLTSHQQLAERQGYTDWTIYRDGVDVTSLISHPPKYDDSFPVEMWDTSQAYIDNDIHQDAYVQSPENTLELQWLATDPNNGYVDVAYTATRTYTRLPGYVLGDQTTKPLAGAGDIPAVTAPSTSASDSGKAADAKATGDALALRLDKTAVVTALKNDSSTESPIEWTDNEKTTLDLANMTDGGVRRCLAAIIRSCGLSVNV